MSLGTPSAVKRSRQPMCGTRLHATRTTARSQADPQRFWALIAKHLIEKRMSLWMSGMSFLFRFSAQLLTHSMEEHNHTCAHTDENKETQACSRKSRIIYSFDTK